MLTRSRSPCVCRMIACYNQTARKESPEMPPGCSRVAGLLFGARFFSDRDVEGFFGHVNHRVIRLGT